MYDPVMRVLTVLEILQARDRVTGAELSERLEVNLRTVQRYIARLQDLSIPVESTRGIGGAYRLKPGFRLPPLMLTGEEAFALTLGLKALRNLGLDAFAPASEGAAAKLSRVLPDSLRESVHGIEDVVALEPGAWVVKVNADSLLRIASAIRTHRRLSFQYESRGHRKSERELEPYGVAHLDGRWYVVGHCLLRDALRTFRLDRMISPCVLPKKFRRPRAFDVKDYLLNVMPFVESAYEVDVWLDLPLWKAKNWFGAHRVALEEHESGTTLRCGRDTLEMFAAMLLSAGCRIVVRHPPEMKQVFAQLAERAWDAAR